MSTFAPKIGDAVIQQFVGDWQALAAELHQLEAQLRMATTGPKDGAAAQRIERRVAKLSQTFERSRDLFAALFAGEWSGHPDVERLRRAMRDISDTISRILHLGNAGHGEGNLAEVVAEAQKPAKNLEVSLKATVGAKEPLISLPQVPPAAAANPMLAVAILLDVVWWLVVGKKAKR